MKLHAYSIFCLFLLSPFISSCTEGHKLIPLKRQITCTVIDAETRMPLKDVKVSTSSSFFGDTKSLESKGVTDVNGLYSFAVKGIFSVVIEKEDYFTLYRGWESGGLKDGSCTLVLTKKPAPVAMFGNRVRYQRVGEWSDSFVIALRFTPKDIDPILPDDTSDVNAELQFVIEQEGDRFVKQRSGREIANKKWVITAVAKGDWEIANTPESCSIEDYDSEYMANAPTQGWSKQLPIKAGDVNSFFLHNTLTGRYGKVYGLRIFDKSNTKRFDFGLRMHYLIQEKETGSRSLNPIEPPSRRNY